MSGSCKTIFISAGEPSGDQHGANLALALRAAQPELRLVGLGAGHMQSAGVELLHDMTSLAIMGVLPVLAKLPAIAALLWRVTRYFRDERPAAVVLIDYPGFHWWLARAARRYGIPVYYYCPPQLWAWARWRVKKLRRLTDHVLCTLPFEEAWYRERGVAATYVGHPYFDQLKQRQHDAQFLAQERARPEPLVTLLPGSRSQELKNNFRWLLAAAAKIHNRHPRVRFAVAAYREGHRARLEQAIAAARVNLPLEVHVGRTPELMQAATCCLATSGSVSLELLYFRKPTAVIYWLPRWSHWLYGRAIKVPYITLVNLLATGRLERTGNSTYRPHDPAHAGVLFPEYPTCVDRSSELAAHVLEWLTNESRCEEREAELAKLKARVCHPGASRRAADYILTTLAHRSDDALRPHFLESGREQPRRP